MNTKHVLRTVSIVATAMCLCAASAKAGPAEDAEAAFSAFFPAFAAHNQSRVAAMFAPDAQFYGTLSPELVSASDGVLKYFTVALDRPDVTVATPLRLASKALSDSVVLIAGSWKLDRTLDGRTTSNGPFRMTAVMQKRDGQWQVVQFHNSLLPPPPPPAPAASR